MDEHLKKLSVNDPNANDADILINEDGEEIINQAKLENYNWSDSEDDEEDDDTVNGGSSTAKKALKDVGKIADVGKPDKITLELPPASTVYFVGDTPESDIRFANSHDASWHSILVKTGVYQAGTEQNINLNICVMTCWKQSNMPLKENMLWNWLNGMKLHKMSMKMIKVQD